MRMSEITRSTVALQEIQRRLPALGRQDAIALGSEQAAQRAQDRRFVVHEKQGRRRR